LLRLRWLVLGVERWMVMNGITQSNEFTSLGVLHVSHICFRRRAFEQRLQILKRCSQEINTVEFRKRAMGEPN
jgi:hypothetical protein